MITRQRQLDVKSGRSCTFGPFWPQQRAAAAAAEDEREAGGLEQAMARAR